MKKRNKLTIDSFPSHSNYILKEVRIKLIKIYNEMIELRDKIAKDFQKHGEYPPKDSLDKVEQNVVTLSCRILVYYNFTIIIKSKGTSCGNYIKTESFENPLCMFNWVLSNAEDKSGTKIFSNEDLKYNKIYDIENYHLYESVQSIYSFLIGYLSYFKKYINFRNEAESDIKRLYEGMGRTVLNHPKSVSANLISTK